MRKGLLTILTGGLIVGGFYAGLAVDGLKEWKGKERQRLAAEWVDKGIKEAEVKGDYRCCIEPPCRMCYLEANQWNGFEAGTCKCDDLIAMGKEACPECGGSFCQTEADD